MSDIREARKVLVSRILEGEGTATKPLRRAAFDDAPLPEPLRAFVAKIAERAHTIDDDDVAEVRASGLSEDEIFELVVCAAVGQATRQYDAALAALDAAARDE
jgi:alkylhydroperoxidase family enzyme